MYTHRYLGSRSGKEHANTPKESKGVVRNTPKESYVRNTYRSRKEYPLGVRRNTLSKDYPKESPRSTLDRDTLLEFPQRYP